MLEGVDVAEDGRYRATVWPDKRRPDRLGDRPVAERIDYLSYEGGRAQRNIGFSASLWGGP